MKPIRKALFDDELSALDPDKAGVLTLTQTAAPRVRSFGNTNWRGLYTLICKETHRFAKIWMQTILSPMVMTFLFYAVFAVGVGPANRMIGSMSFLQFLLPGLIMMSMAQSSFANTSSSLILSKIQGNIVDTLMPPLTPLELTVAYTIGGVLRGLVVGAVSILVLWLFQPVVAHDFFFFAYHAVMGCMMMALLGLITGILGDKFDHLGAVQNFIIMPATFLSGTFFTTGNLSDGWEFFCHLNPFFYMIDGFRYGWTGYADGQLLGGLASILIVNMVLFNIVYWLFANGTRLKS